MAIQSINQILLLIVITVLSSVLTVAGLEVIKILKEFRVSIQKLNQVLDDAHLLTSSVAKPVVGISNFISGLKSGIDVVSLLLSAKKKKEENE